MDELIIIHNNLIVLNVNSESSFKLPIRNFVIEVSYHRRLLFALKNFQARSVGVFIISDKSRVVQ